MSVVDIVIYDEFKDMVRHGRKWILVTGFPGFGYVGTIAMRYMVEKLKAVKIGDIITKYMPDFVTLEDYGLMTPYELFAYPMRSLLILVNNAVPHPPERVAFAKKVVNWFISIGGGKAILTGGLNIKFREGEEEFRWLCTDNCGWLFKEPQLDKGLYIVGPLATLFTILKINKVPTLVVLPYTEPSKYDPKAAAVFVKRISDLLNLNIGIDDLLHYSKVVEETEAAIKEAMKVASEERGPKPYM